MRRSAPHSDAPRGLRASEPNATAERLLEPVGLGRRGQQTPLRNRTLTARRPM
jgi:hypothetical protein